ncbi:DUF5813 family protein [Halalkalicoccus jeotgali]|uniref:Uncharacterized protein n=1 Tax=Halalkalicoccus jeotgali (strain DSM 18796 / CECT 7217 / JCM 14584 / KCTC 4019 / B3) TaxID=795797 RepID=D8J9I1_HALJB|nr:DUF5813 family protein [Halalkalicoccus jeotgali]ADJ14393.1 hypothetical protein HacjB3_05010 [Halalkalicoccus jeotgali B3]ELY40654.1 hypothetical protein C497_03387 [Halalkalicoccus jeotgali B3]
MTDPDDALTGHAAYEPAATGHELTTTPFEAVVETDDEDGETRYRVVVRVPTLDAVVEGETVAGVVEDGWFDTLTLRLDDPEGVTTGLESIDTDVSRDGREVRVEMAFSSANPERAAENAKALTEYVEGTWVQGIVPGYEYGEPAASLLDRASRNYDDT